MLARTEAPNTPGGRGGMIVACKGNMKRWRNILVEKP
jgi:hypothetical protein